MTAELTLAPAVNKDPDHDQWAAYWQEMREESITLISQAFDQVAELFADNDAGAAVDVVMFCAQESQSAIGIADAVHDLLTHHMSTHQVAAEYRAGVSMSDLIKIVTP